MVVQFYFPEISKGTVIFIHCFFRSPNSKIGADPSLTGALTWLEWEEFFKNDPKNLTLESIIQNPIDDIWLGRPSRPQKELEVHDVKYAGMNTPL